MRCAEYSCTDPSPGLQNNLHSPPLTGKAFFSAENKGTGKKENIWNCIISCFVKGLGLCFLESFYSSVSIFQTIQRSHLLWKPQDTNLQRLSWLPHAAGGRCASWLIPYFSGLPQITHFNPISPLQTTAWDCQPEWYLDDDLAKAGLAVILDSLFALHHTTESLWLSFPDIHGIQLPFSTPNATLPVYTPHSVASQWSPFIHFLLFHQRDLSTVLTSGHIPAHFFSLLSKFP